MKDALEVYIGLWQKAIGKGIVSAADDMESALEKIEKAGGLYKAAEEDPPPF